MHLKQTVQFFKHLSHLHQARILLLVLIQLTEHPVLMMVVPATQHTYIYTAHQYPLNGRLTPKWLVLHMAVPPQSSFHTSFPWLLSPNTVKLATMSNTLEEQEEVLHASHPPTRSISLAKREWWEQTHIRVCRHTDCPVQTAASIALPLSTESSITITGRAVRLQFVFRPGLFSEGLTCYICQCLYIQSVMSQSSTQENDSQIMPGPVQLFQDVPHAILHTKMKGGGVVRRP